MKEIQLTQGKVALVDDEDYERLVAFGSWELSTQGYAVRTRRQRNQDGSLVSISTRMHREVMGLAHGDKLEVDHISGDRLDNRKSNLRVCSKTENLRNIKTHKDNTSGFKGVSFLKVKRKYQARLTFKYKTMYFGLFTCPIEAARAYNDAALIHHGEFARLNDIPA